MAKKVDPPIEPLAQPLNSREMLIVREVELDGIKIWVQIDFRKGQASLVEWNDNKDEWVPKKWLFAEREPGYLRTWVKIFEAMAAATAMALLELDESAQEQLDFILQHHFDLEPMKPKGGKVKP